MRDSRLYLLSGNGSTSAWWEEALPHFQKCEPIPLELPGFGDNLSDQFQSLGELAEALIEMTEPGHPIFAVGVNGLVVLHALVRRPEHFSRVMLLAPVGAFLWERSFVKWMGMKPVRKLIHFLLARWPRIFRRRFTSKEWTASRWKMIAEGYRKCRAFQKYFDIVKPESALDLFEWIPTPIDLIWGTKDGVLGVEQAAAWDSILPRADLTITIRDDWGHYPYLDDPEGFARDIESFQSDIPAHTKGGRLELARLAGLPVPHQVSVSSVDALPEVLSTLPSDCLYAVRSSGANEDHIDHSHAGRNETFLRVPLDQVAEKASILLQEHQLASAVIQRFIEPRVSGVAFCRWCSLEVEYVVGHPEQLVSGEVTPGRAILTKMGGDWALAPDPIEEHPDFDFSKLEQFLREALRAFHYHPSDIEWAWDGEELHLLQLRPVTSYDWRRSLTSANLDELLPSQVSRLMEHAQRRASLSISRIYALWDPRVLNDHEPFSAVFEDASYVNVDLFLSRLCDWGLPGRLLSKEIGGAVPHLPFRFFRFLRSIPTLLRMYRIIRREIRNVESGLRQFEKELECLTDETDLVNWFVRYYVFIVRSNMIINACVTTGGGSFLGRAKTVYHNLDAETAPHRLQFESDPATPRPEVEAPPIEPFPKWGWLTRFLNWLGVPGLGGRYFEVREWFRDNNMRMFFRLHHVLKTSAWMEPHPGLRERQGTFWQSGGETLQQDFSFVIYPGRAEGIVGDDILIVDALEPGHYEQYQQAKAVIARTGGRLSHGSTLLRELRKPSAVIQDAPSDWQGKSIAYDNGSLVLLDEGT